MKYLGVDFGGKHVGLSASDEGGKLAFPKKTLPNDGTLIKEIEKICESENIGRVVIGRSIDQSGNENPIQFQINSFSESLRAELDNRNIPVVFMDERFTSAHVLKDGGNGAKEADHSEAAAIILQRYLDKVNYKNGNQ